MLVWLICPAPCPGCNSTVYEEGLRRSQNSLRWLEYSVTAALMRIMIAQLSGVTSIHLLATIAGLTASTMAFGCLQERCNWLLQGRPRDKTFLPLLLGCVPHLFTWGLIASHFYGLAAHSTPPHWVWVIFIVRAYLSVCTRRGCPTTRPYAPLFLVFYFLSVLVGFPWAANAAMGGAD